jgi:hypothetical protein
MLLFGGLYSVLVFRGLRPLVDGPVGWRTPRLFLFFSESSFQLENSMMFSRKYYGQDPGNHIEYINQYDVADL